MKLMYWSEEAFVDEELNDIKSKNQNEEVWNIPFGPNSKNF